MDMDGNGSLTGLILAGGKSTRFGSDKASAVVAGKPMLQWVAQALQVACDRLVIVRAAEQVLPRLELAKSAVVVEDRWEARGPLAGLASGLPAVETDYCFAASCDAPLLQPRLVQFLADRARGHDVALVEVARRLNPLVAAYRAATCLPGFEKAVERGDLKITDAFAGLDVLVVDEGEASAQDPGLFSFRNANRPDSLEEVEAILGRRGAAPQ
ncbi:molybdenum cofactor guanylyltransferase [bacterium]|nr:MAG: molybdenum cofactor guanylyltransferase [bacterium]